LKTHHAKKQLQNLRVTGTSNLLANNKAWDVLKNKFQIDFGNYGDWASVLIDSAEQNILWVVFLDDLVSPDRLTFDMNISIENQLEVLLKPLTEHLMSKQSITLIAFSTWRWESIISNSRQSSPWIQMANRFLEELHALMEKHQTLYLLSMDEVFSKQGMIKCFDARNFYISRCRMSIMGLELLADAAQTVFDRIKNAAKKVLVLDCDNTLWGGVVGEVGLSGITLGSDGIGQAFTDFQLAVNRWASQGVLLTIASKNNEGDVWKVFNKHPGMQIQKDDLVAWRINWQEKAVNLQQMASELNLGIDSFVFWDDNPFEREKIRLALPDVITLDIPQDVTAWPAFLDSLDFFARFSVTMEDRKKVQQYKQRTAFVSERKQVRNQVAFLKSIDLQPTVLPLSEETLARAEQLCQKTNQFNIRTERHTALVLRKLSGNPNYESFLVKLSDRFGDHGIVCLALARIDGKAAFLDTFLMSCRIFGRHLEAWVLQELGKRLKAKACKWILAEFRPTQRNAVAASFLPDHGLTSFDWNQLPDNHPVHLLRDLTYKTGQHYYAELETLKIPHLEAFQNEDI
tara:strand:+ start:853 stop:2568 length:1716 start_codon:yes stop_codon:yes gene_type:complete